MILLAIVLSAFAAAPLAPWLHRLLAGGGDASRPHRTAPTGLVLALLPAAIAGTLVWLASGGSPSPDAPPGPQILELHDWVPGLGVTAGFRLDGLSLLMALLVSGIGSLILIYAGGYLAGHPQLGRLYAYLLLFMGSMLGMVLSDNLILLFVFWELTSVSSYLLIGFDHDRIKARKSALTALLVTGFGGLSLLAGFILIGIAAGTLEISTLLSDRGLLEGHPLATPIILLVVLGAFTKSAQFPFHFWLPAAMEAPTPVSAYLHSSTMVKAGVFLLARLTPVFGWSELWSHLLLWFGAVTMVVGAWLAFRQSKMKPLLAYTTVSSLGVLVCALGVGSVAAVEAAMALLLAHAFYKGALFMIAGAIDHETGEKDLDRLGGLRGAMPLLCAATFLAAASMIGLPPFLGFVAKELVLDSMIAATEAGRFGPVILGAMIVTAAIGVAVAARFAIKPFLGTLRTTPKSAHEPPSSLLAGPLLLSILGVIAVVLPGLFALPLVRFASSATLQAMTSPDLGLWHGVKPALLASLAAIGIGAGLYLGRGGVLALASPLARLDAVGPARAYEAIVAGVLGFAAFQSRVLQSGYLRKYLFCTAATAIVAVVGTFLLHGHIADRATVSRWLTELTTEVRFYEFGLVALIIVGAIFTAMARTRLAAVAGLGLVGYGVALTFVLYGAPDLALTQLCVETLSVVLLVLVFRFLPDFRIISHRTRRLRDLLLATAGGIMAAGLVLLTTTVRSERDISAFYARASLPEAHGRNVVNVILVDFRGLDTLGEITVLAVAAVGVLTLLRMSPWNPTRRRAEDGGSSA